MDTSSVVIPSSAVCIGPANPALPVLAAPTAVHDSKRTRTARGTDVISVQVKSCQQYGQQCDHSDSLEHKLHVQVREQVREQVQNMQQQMQEMKQQMQAAGKDAT